MSKTVDFRGKPFHFIGIGGIGMSALAYILAKRQLPVSGSDLRATPITERLRSVGAHIFGAQEATNLDFFQSMSSKAQVRGGALESEGLSRNGTGCAPREAAPCGTAPADREASPQVICSTAIAATNLEYQAAKEKGYDIFHRSDLLAALMSDYSESIAVAGTHGKTTTSSAIAHLLVQAGVDPTVIVGGEINSLGGNARLGQGGVLVAEADESDGTLTKLAPQIGIITNIELDHPDHYSSLEEVVDTFQTFAAQCKTLIGCKDCTVVRDRLNPHITYSLDPDSQADYIATDATYDGEGTRAKIWERGQMLGELQWQLLGRHNLSNALAAIAAARVLGLEFDAIAAALKSFEGAKRRFEFRGEGNGITFFDDYAHHPSEIEVTLAAARLRVGASHRVVAIFQPHRYSRTQTFLQEFARCFSDADIAIVTDIYSAGEANPDNFSGRDLVDAIAAYHSHVIYQPTFDALESCLTEILQPGDLALFMGAGNLNQIVPKLVAFYNP